MWKREEAAKPVTPSPAATGPGPTSGVSRPPVRAGERDVSVGSIGKSVVIKGELNGSEDLTIEGQVEGKIELREHVLTIGSHGRIRAEVFAKIVVVQGEVTGNIKATEKVSIQDSGAVEGDITAPKVAIAEGARFRGSVDMSPAGQQESGRTASAQGAPPRAQPQASGQKPGKAGAGSKASGAS
jgi:cytoskeletal protein CcmA (bactofilin family)